MATPPPPYFGQCQKEHIFFQGLFPYSSWDVALITYTRIL